MGFRFTAALCGLALALGCTSSERPAPTYTQGPLGLDPTRNVIQPGDQVPLLDISRDIPSASSLAERVTVMAEAVTGDEGFSEEARIWAAVAIDPDARATGRPFADHPELVVMYEPLPGRLSVMDMDRRRMPPGLDLSDENTGTDHGVGAAAAESVMISVYSKLVDGGVVDGSKYSPQLLSANSRMASSHGPSGSATWVNEYIFSMRPYRNSIPILDARLKIGIDSGGDPSSVEYQNVVIEQRGTVVATLGESEAEPAFRTRALALSRPTTPTPSLGLTHNGIVYVLDATETSGTVGPVYFGKFSFGSSRAELGTLSIVEPEDALSIVWP